MKYDIVMALLCIEVGVGIGEGLNVLAVWVLQLYQFCYRSMNLPFFNKVL